MSALFGVVGVFAGPDAVRSATTRLHEMGYRAFDSYTPYPVEGVREIIDPGPHRALPLFIFFGALIGAACGYWVQYWEEAVNYPINVGGRPHNSWPAFAVSTFEFMVLFALSAALVGFLAASRLPQLYHPLFDASHFARASRDRFLICVEATDPRFDADAITELLRELGAGRVERVSA